MKLLFWIIIGIPLLLGIANLFLRIILGYWSPLFKWLLLGYLSIFAIFIAGFILYCRALERSNEIGRQRTIADSLKKLENQLYWARFDKKDTSDLERALREIRR